MASWDDVYWTMLRWGCKDANGLELLADQASEISGGRNAGISDNALVTFPPMSYDMYYTTYFNDISILKLEVTHIEWGEGNDHHEYDIDEICFYKEGNNPYGHFSFYYQGTKIPGLEANAGTTAALGITVIEGIELHLNNFVTISPVAWVKYAGGGVYEKAVSLSFNDNISDYMKGHVESAAPFDYEYVPSDATDLFSAIFDAQLKGNYWDSKGNAGTPIDTGGGLGDYRRPDYEVSVPPLPSLSVCDTGFIKLYDISIAELNDLAADLWSSNFFDSIIKNFRSPLDNIISLSMIPFDGFLGELTQVEVGNFQSSAAANRLSTSFYEIDCGIIDITEYYGTYADWTDTKIQLYLPMCTTININPDDCMAGKIRVVYHFDIFSGACVAYVQTITKGAWHVLYTVEGNVKAELPMNGQNYLSVYTNAARAGLGMAGNLATGNLGGMISTGINAVEGIKPTYQRTGSIGGTAGLMGVLYPYLIFTTPQVVIPEGFKATKGYVSNIKTKIGSASGYLSATVDNEQLTGFKCTDVEKEMIKTILSEGIYI